MKAYATSSSTAGAHTSPLSLSTPPPQSATLSIGQNWCRDLTCSTNPWPGMKCNNRSRGRPEAMPDNIARVRLGESVSKLAPPQERANHTEGDRIYRQRANRRVHRFGNPHHKKSRDERTQALKEQPRPTHRKKIRPQTDRKQLHLGGPMDW